MNIIEFNFNNRINNSYSKVNADNEKKVAEEIGSKIFDYLNNKSSKALGFSKEQIIILVSEHLTDLDQDANPELLIKDLAQKLIELQEWHNLKDQNGFLLKEENLQEILNENYPAFKVKNFQNNISPNDKAALIKNGTPEDIFSCVRAGIFNKKESEKIMKTAVDKLLSQEIPAIKATPQPLANYSSSLFNPYIKQGKSNLQLILEHSDLIKEYSWGKDFFLKVAAEQPNLMLEHIEIIQDKPWVTEILKNIFQTENISTENILSLKISPLSSIKIIQMAAEYAHLYKKESWAKKVLDKTTDISPSKILINYQKFSDQPWAEELLKKAVTKLIRGKNVLNKLNKTYFNTNLSRAQSLQLSKKIGLNIKLELAESRGDFLKTYCHLYNQELWFKTLILEEAKTHPISVLETASSLPKETWAKEVIKTILISSPSLAMHYIDLIDKNTSDPALKKLQEIYEYQKSNKNCPKNITLLFELILKENLSLPEAAEIAQDSGRFFKALVTIKHRPAHLGSKEIDNELQIIALKVIRQINDRHEGPLANKRFEAVENYTADELYILISYGEAELFTSSFNGLMDRLLIKLENEQRSIYELLKGNNYNKFREFLRQCVNRNRLEDLFKQITAEEKTTILSKFICGIDKAADPLSEAAIIADTIYTLVRSDLDTMNMILEYLKKEYTRASKLGDKKIIVLYGLLASIIGEKATLHQEWFKQMNILYEISALTMIPKNKLFNEQGHFQQYFFFNDEDGKSSFDSFLGNYEDKQKWEIEDKDDYVIIRSTKKDPLFEIYANKPTAEGETSGVASISEEFNKKGISPQISVLRGHSYHAMKMIRHLTDSAQIVYLGSCGGYNNISEVLKRAPEAHIISTKGTGTKYVNDPLLMLINNAILSGNDIDWPALWASAEQEIANIEEFKNYVAPHENMGLTFLKAFNREIASKPST
ncbi:MAG: hypothetical protein KKA19_08855 [Candidatus Margulisbacteria bacterium]|nr:hypothetical protein [Candidatus Margulisiibacteriota bacterium]